MDHKGEQPLIICTTLLDPIQAVSLAPLVDEASITPPLCTDDPDEIVPSLGDPEEKDTATTSAVPAHKVNARGRSSTLNRIGRPTLLLPLPNPSPARVSFAINDQDLRVPGGADHLPRPHRSSPYRVTPAVERFTTCTSIKDGYVPGEPFNQRHSISALREELVEICTGSTEPVTTRKTGRTRRMIWESIKLVWLYISVQLCSVSTVFLPGLYYRRSTAIFEEAQCSGKCLRNAIIECIRPQRKEPQYEYFTPVVTGLDSTDMVLEQALMSSRCPPELRWLQGKWNHFIDALIKEWKIMNLVSVLLLSVFVSSMQIGPAFADEIVRYIAFAGMICCLMSLVYGCANSIGISTMRPIHKAVAWAEAGEERRIAPFWNHWMFLSIPAIWLFWALILFLTEILAFAWLIDGPDHALTLSPGLKLTVQIGVTLILAMGLVYLGLILSTLKKYGTQMDEVWRDKIRNRSASSKNKRK